MGLTLIEAAKYENRLEHLAVLKTFSEGELPGVNYVGGSRQLRRRVPPAPPCHGRGVQGGQSALPCSAFQRWSEGF